MTVISTLKSQIDFAIYLQNKVNSAYVAIGRSTPWVDENNPPEEDENTVLLDEVIGYKKVSKFSLARPLADGESTDYPVVDYRGENWVLVPAAAAYDEGAKWLYAEARLMPEDFPLGKYRQVGLHLELQPNTGVTKPNLTPLEVRDPGTLYFYTNNPPIDRTAGISATEQFLMEI